MILLTAGRHALRPMVDLAAHRDKSVQRQATARREDMATNRVAQLTRALGGRGSAVCQWPGRWLSASPRRRRD